MVRLDKQLSDFLRLHEDQFSFEIAGESETLVADPAEPLFFYAVRVPKTIVDLYVEEFGESSRQNIEDIASFSLSRWPSEMDPADSKSEKQ